jgi:predicted RNA-binding Zn-ribbon protein involved in translation (DUF1610 family)
MQALVRNIRCVVATHSYKIGDIVCRQSSPVFDSMNHSCRPNASIKDKYIVASQHIDSGSEIMVDFSTTKNTAKTCPDCGSDVLGMSTQCLRATGNI